MDKETMTAVLVVFGSAMIILGQIMLLVGVYNWNK